ncbi:bifunctional metallophosphatase/5'-nucleotidase [Janthinobacterium sp. GB4P2]|uniref:bifunctional metallophosphatase/5'-nucleotidase n=1 Tax=Janthinobacterium sp. GB4P2 TaxID=3424189 RepID=UPI003F23C49D
MAHFLRTPVASAALILSLSACSHFASVPQPAPSGPIEVNLVALNDFHGNLDRSKFTYTSVVDAERRTVQAGGIDTLSGALTAWRREDAQLIFVGNGDLVGASPAMSALWADEPSIVAMNMLGMKASSVGNHEFDQGKAELLRQQRGGCESSRADKACKFTSDFKGASYTYMAANVIDTQTGKSLLPAYRIEEAHGVKVGLIGAVLKDTPSVVTAAGIAGLQFGDEADAINATLPQLRAQGVGVFVVLLHQGGETKEAVDQPDCSHLKGEVVDVVKRLDPAIKLVISGHSHQGYLCRVDGRLVTQAQMGGHMLTRIKLKVDPVKNAVVDASAQNVVMLPGMYEPDPAVAAYLESVKQRSAAELSRPVALIAVPNVGRSTKGGGASPLGDLVADSTLFGARAAGAQIGLMNNGGIRKDLEAGADLMTNVGQNQAVVPFGNTLIVVSLSGAQIRTLLEQQWPGEEAGEGNLLQVSEGFSYRWDSTQPQGQRVLLGSIMLNGLPLEDNQQYRVAANSFLAGGGDRFTVLAAGTRRLDTGVRDIDAFSNYLIARARAGKPAGSATAAGRIVRVK